MNARNQFIDNRTLRFSFLPEGVERHVATIVQSLKCDNAECLVLRSARCTKRKKRRERENERSRDCEADHTRFLSVQSADDKDSHSLSNISDQPQAQENERWTTYETSTNSAKEQREKEKSETRLVEASAHIVYRFVG